MRSLYYKAAESFSQTYEFFIFNFSADKGIILRLEIDGLLLSRNIV